MIGKPIDKVNWYRLVSVNRWSIDKYTKTNHRLLSTGTATSNRRHARYLSDHSPFLGSPGKEIGKTIPTQSSRGKEYTCTLLHVYSNYPHAHHCLSASYNVYARSPGRGFSDYKVHRQRLWSFSVLSWTSVKCLLLPRRGKNVKTRIVFHFGQHFQTSGVFVFG